MTTRERKIIRCKAEIEKAKVWLKYYTTEEKSARMAATWTRALSRLKKELASLEKGKTS